MAALDVIGFMEKLEATEAPPFTSPQWRYGAEEDALTFYFRNEESYAHRLNEYVTIFLAFDGDQLVGCQVKGVRRRLKSDGQFAVSLVGQSGKVEIGMIFHLLAYDTPDPRLVELGQRAKGLNVDASELMPSS